MIELNLVCKFECINCGAVSEVTFPNKLSQYRHTSLRFFKPDKCGCGNKAMYKLLDITMTDKKILQEELLKENNEIDNRIFDIDRMTSGITQSKRAKTFIIREALNELKKDLGKRIKLDKLVEHIGDKLNGEEISKVISLMEREGTLFKPRKGEVQLLE